MVLGIVSLVFFLIPFFPLPVAIVGLVLSIIGHQKGEGPMAIAGLVCSIIAIALNILMIIIYFVTGTP
jgi:hypothetical protein